MLMLQAEKDYVHCENGLRMLVSQAAASSELFTGSSYSEDDVERIYRSIDFEMKNILLIGMPGCGKSTVGKLLAEKLNRELLDTDEEIEKRTGRSPAEIIKTDGETEFRRIETEVLRDISILSGKIISCGGGIISPKENRGLLRRNSNVVWLQREISSLVSEGRPLSQIIGNRELYRYREPLYMESAEYVVNNDGDVNDTVNKIIEAIGR
jgi:Shikimate kinase